MLRHRYDFYVADVLNRFNVKLLSDLTEANFNRLIEFFYDEQTTGVTFLKAAIDDHFETVKVINLMKCYRLAELDYKEKHDENILKLSDEELLKVYGTVKESESSDGPLSPIQSWP